METVPFEQIGRFQIESPVGQGAMGIVYRANDPVLDRTVAIKLLAPHLGKNSTARARFKREANLISSLKHTHIATVYDSGSHESRPYIAMEWIEGRTLTQLLTDEGALPIDRALNLFKQLANGLDYAHANGVIHRDLKPSNIIVNSFDQVTIVDFGLAWIADAPSLTATGAMLGTPLYMAPEQIQGGTIDGRTDQYALAIILYEMLSGTPPFPPASNTALFHQQLYAAPPPITESNPKIPFFIEEALSVALEKSAESRYASVATFQAALTPIAAAQTHKKRTYRKIATALAIAFALLVLIVGGWYAFPKLREIPQETVDAITISPDWGYGWRSSNGDNNQARFSDIELDIDPMSLQWQSDWVAGESSAPIISGGRVVIAESDRLYGLDWANAEIVWETPLGAPMATAPLAFAGWEYDLIFIAQQGGGLTALAMDDRQLLWQVVAADIEGNINHIATDQNSRLVITTDENQLYLLDAYDGSHIFELSLDDLSSLPFAPSVNSLGIFIADNEGELAAIDIASGTLDWVSETAGVAITAPLIIANDAAQNIVVASDTDMVQAFSLLNGNLLWEAELDGTIRGLAANWGGLFATTDKGFLYFIDFTDGEIVWSRDMNQAPVGAPTVTGNQIIVATDENKVRFFSAEDGTEFTDKLIELDELIVEGPIFVADWLFVRGEFNINAYAP